MTSSITMSELERLRKIERLAQEAVKPNPPEKHSQALSALREVLGEPEKPSVQEVRRGAVTQEIFPKNR